jgi:hypothetical protein
MWPANTEHSLDRGRREGGRPMNLHHTAALALTGWYLMLPPLHFIGPGNDPHSVAIVDDTAPLSRWLPMMSFKTLQECDNFSTRLARNMRKSVRTERDKKDVETLIGIWLGKYQCVATEDPRITKNSPPQDLAR